MHQCWIQGQLRRGARAPGTLRYECRQSYVQGGSRAGTPTAEIPTYSRRMGLVTLGHPSRTGFRFVEEVHLEQGSVLLMALDIK